MPAADWVGGWRGDGDIVLRRVILAGVVLCGGVGRLVVGGALVVGVFAVIRLGFVVVATAADEGQARGAHTSAAAGAQQRTPTHPLSMQTGPIRRLGHSAPRITPTARALRPNRF